VTANRVERIEKDMADLEDKVNVLLETRLPAIESRLTLAEWKGGLVGSIIILAATIGSVLFQLFLRYGGSKP